jgi:hypothetical protein
MVASRRFFTYPPLFLETYCIEQKRKKEVIAYRKDNFTTHRIGIVQILNEKNRNIFTKNLLRSCKVEKMGVEPTTSCMPCKRSSQLSYIPVISAANIL